MSSSTLPTKPASAPASRPLSPAEALAEMDPRTPVPLQPMMAWHQKQNMMEHLSVIQRLTGALAVLDWDAATAAATTIGSSPQMQKMCEHMGAGAEGFTDVALEFHRRADGIAAATKNKDLSAALLATSHTLQACTGCHARFRQDVIDAATWQARVSD